MADGSELPFEVLNGAPGYINVLDALNGWQLVRELRAALGQPAAASFKHVSPAGAAIGLPLSDALRRAYAVEDLELSPLAAAYARARGADRVSSYGDWVALSEPLDVATARLLRREVSDGVIAPAIEPAALDLLRKKRDGNYVVLRIDPAYEPPATETRQVFGVTFEQARNAFVPSFADLGRVVTQRTDVPDSALRDMLLALITLKYTQSNSVCFVKDGQVIGNGAGQQSRIHCTRIAAEKADLWHLRQHPRALALDTPGLGRVERDNAIDDFLRHGLTVDDRQAWLVAQSGAVVGSDAYFPFRDNIDRAAESGAGYVVQPGGAMRDADIIAACDEHQMAMVLTGVRLFHH